MKSKMIKLDPTIVECTGGDFFIDASDAGFMPGDSWPFNLQAAGMTWTFNRPIINGKGEDAGNIYIAIDTAGCRRELHILTTERTHNVHEKVRDQT